MKIAAAVLLAITLVAGATVYPRVTRNNLLSLEKLADRKIVPAEPGSPGQILGATRGVYLEGYGAVFTTEVDLIAFAATNPFRAPYTDADIAKLRVEKQARIASLKKRMMESLVIMAKGLEGVAANEQVALAVTIPYWPWEKSAGMPRQILIHAPKSALVSGADLNESIRVQEF